MQNEFKEGKIMDWQDLSLFPPIISLKLPVVWLDFLRKLSCRLGCGAQERCVWPQKMQAGGLICVSQMMSSNYGCPM